jgi:tetratricopeptide (TPR) repeat protein
MMAKYAALAMIWLFVAAPVLADPAQEWAACSVTDVPGAPRVDTPQAVKRVVAACTARLGAKDESADRRGVAYANRANAYLMLRNYDAALADAGQSIALLPKLFIGFMVRGAVYLVQHKPDRALAEFDQVVLLRPDDATAYNNRGFAYFRLGRKDRAVQDFSQSLKLAPRDASTLNNRANAYADLNQRDHALADFDAVTALKPGYAEGWNQACWRRAVWGMQMATALEYCNKAVALAPKNASIVDSRCLVHFLMRDYAAAIRDCDAALALRPTEWTSRYVRGVARLRTGDRAAGEADIAAARAADAKLVETYAGYGVKP